MRKYNKNLIRKSLTVCLIASLVLPGIPFKTYAEQSTVSQNDPDNSSEIIYIKSVEDLIDLAEKCHADDWSTDKTIELTQDILLSSQFTSIPVFNGYFKGNGHTISGYQYGGDGYVTGFFRYVGKNGLVEDLTLAGSIRTPASAKVTGSIAGINYGMIKNCTYSGTIKSDSETGGIVGVNESSGTVLNCVNNGEILGYYFTGGIAGKNYGILQDCTNKGTVNNTKEWVTEDDERTPDLLSGLRDDQSSVKLQSGTDTGGIVGMSKGFVRGSANEGVVGYEHVGYNVGGIAGRQAGGVENCVNQGKVLGRKDVGGIVGQMEPYIAITDENTITNSVNALHASINSAIDDADETNESLTRDMNELKYYSDQNINTGNEIYDSTRDYVNANTEAANQMIARITDVMNSLNRIIAGTSMEDIDGLSSMMSELRHEIETNSSLSEADRARAMAKYEEAEGYYNALVASLEHIAVLEKELAEENDPLKRAAIEAQINAERLNAQKNAANLQKCLAEIRSILATYTDLQLVQIDRNLDSDMNDLHSNLDSMSKVLDRITNNTGKYSKTFTNDLRTINNNLMSVYDALDNRFTELTNNDGIIYTDVSDVEILTATLGKVSSSTNNGVVNGDINIGGITGSMAIDEEDPEENAAGSVDKNLDATYTTQNIILDCTNNGYITSKNDGAGGIAGFMRHGIISESRCFGSVTSTGGNYVGGICGQSLSIIQDSYVLSTLSGGDYVGGVAGFGTTVKNCLTMPSITNHTGRFGALCGQIKIDSDTEVPHLESIVNNFYVGEYLNGIDDIDYKGAIDCISYDTLTEFPDLPSEYRNLRIIFRADDTYVGAKNVNYGDRYADIEFPEVPYKEGYYGTWPDTAYETVHGNLVLDAQYTENITVLTSNTSDDSQKILGLIDDVFDGDASLEIEKIYDSASGYMQMYDSVPPYMNAKDYVIYRVNLSAGEDRDTPYRLRLFNPYGSKIKVLSLKPNTFETGWTPVEYQIRGSYAEVSFSGGTQVYCIAKQTDHTPYIIGGCAGVVLFLIIVLIMRKFRKRRQMKKKLKTEARNETETGIGTETENETEIGTKTGNDAEDK